MTTTMDDGAATSTAVAKSSEKPSISFDWTIEMSASGDETEATKATTIASSSKPHQTSSFLGPKLQDQHVMPMISPDDGSMAWDEASVSSMASKSLLCGPRVRFQGVTAFHTASQKTEDEEQSIIEKLQHDISRQRSLRKRKEKALIKLAGELTKRTEEVKQRDAKIVKQTKIIHQLQVEQAASTSSEQEVTHLRKELLRLQLSNDRLQTRWTSPFTVWNMAAVVMLACLIHFVSML